MSLLFWRKTRDVAPDNAQSVAVTETTPLPVQVFNNEDEEPLRVYTVREPGAGRDPELSNLTLTSADTEYSLSLPADCYLYEWQCRTAADVRWAPVTGKVATPTAPYMTLKASDYYTSPLFGSGQQAPGKLYFGSATAGVVVELAVWR